MVDVNVGEGHT